MLRGTQRPDREIGGEEVPENQIWKRGPEAPGAGGAGPGERGRRRGAAERCPRC